MRLLSVIILYLSVSALFAQNDVKIYSWEEVQTADPDTIYAIDLSKNKLDSLPDKLFEFVNLTHLNLRKNKLAELDERILNFTFLETLNLGKNKLDIFPVQLCRMKSVTNLILYSNKIETLPACVEYLIVLENLDLYDNPIRTLPDSIVNIKTIKRIDLSGIKFSPLFQETWHNKLPEVDFNFDPPCDCMK